MRPPSYPTRTSNTTYTMRINFFNDPIEGDERKKVDACQRLYSVADNARRPSESDWINNALYLAGNQFQSAADDVRRWGRRDVRTPETGKVKMVSNMILPLTRQAASSIWENTADQVATPATGDEADVAAAELATDLLQGRFYEDNEREKQLHEIMWCMLAGSCMRKTYWDPEADSVMWDGSQVKGAGDIVTETLNPFKYHVSPWYDSQGDLPWVIESDVRDIDEINDLFPGHDVKPESYADVTRNIDKLLTNLVEHRDTVAQKRDHAAILKRLYHKPTTTSPNGKVLVWSNWKLLAETELPEGEMPFTRLQWFPIVGRVYPLPFISPLRDLQKQINIILSQLIELKNRQLRGDIVVKGVGNLTQEYVLNEAGQKTSQKVVRVPSGVVDWKFMEYNLNVGEAERLLAKLWTDMMKIAGLNEPSLGQTPPRQTTLGQLQMLKESDLVGLTLFRAGFDIAYSKVARLKLVVAKNNYELPRMIRIVGEANAVKTQAFFGSDLRNTEDVRPKPAPLITESMRAEIKQQAIDKGLFVMTGDPTDMLAKCRALLNSGLPEMREEVDKMLSPMTLEDLEEVVGQINMLRVKQAMVTEQAKLKMIIEQVSMAAQPAPEQEVEQAQPEQVPAQV